MFSIGNDGNLRVEFKPLLPLRTSVAGLNNISRIPYCWGRQKGATWAAVHNMAGLIENLPPRSNILYIIPNREWLYHIIKYTGLILEEHGIGAMYYGINKLIAAGNTRVFFVHTDVDQLYGLDAYRVFDSGEARHYSYLGASSVTKYRLRDFWHVAQTLPTMRFRYSVVQGPEVYGGQIIKSTPI